MEGASALAAKLLNVKSPLSVDSLLDTLIAVAEDCSYPTVRRARNIETFVSRYGELAKQAAELRLRESDFERIQLIGRGSFGDVFLVRHAHSRKVFAMKVLNKIDMIVRAGTTFYWEERDIMAHADSDWIVQLHYAFQDATSLYMVMEYMPGGDIVSLMENHAISEEWTRFYTAELVLALDALHSMGYIHRDVKPDNMLIALSGHMKLVDFGTCLRTDKDGRVRCMTAVGTPDYISPELLELQGREAVYGQEIDWWAVGIFVYEMLCGETPFYSDSLAETYNRIQHYETELSFPDVTEIEMSEAVKDLIRKFLSGCDTRLGKGGAQQVKEHAFFANDKWTFENIRQAMPPYVPQLNGDDDTSRFTNISQKKSHLTPHLQSPKTFAGNQLPFVGFTYSNDLGPAAEICKMLASCGEPNFANSSSVSVEFNSSTTFVEGNDGELKACREQLNDLQLILNTEKEKGGKQAERIACLEEQLTAKSQLEATVRSLEQLVIELTSRNERQKEKEELWAAERAELIARLAAQSDTSNALRGQLSECGENVHLICPPGDQSAGGESSKEHSRIAELSAQYSASSESSTQLSVDADSSKTASSPKGQFTEISLSDEQSANSRDSQQKAALRVEQDLKCALEKIATLEEELHNMADSKRLTDERHLDDAVKVLVATRIASENVSTKELRVRSLAEDVERDLAIIDDVFQFLPSQENGSVSYSPAKSRLSISDVSAIDDQLYSERRYRQLESKFEREKMLKLSAITKLEKVTEELDLLKANEKKGQAQLRWSSNRRARKVAELEKELKTVACEYEGRIARIMKENELLKDALLEEERINMELRNDLSDLENLEVIMNEQKKGGMLRRCERVSSSKRPTSVHSTCMSGLSEKDWNYEGAVSIRLNQKKKHLWRDCFAIFNSEMLTFYASRYERHTVESLHSNGIIHVRKVTPADVRCAVDSDLPRIFQLFYDRGERWFGSVRSSVSDVSSTNECLRGQYGHELVDVTFHMPMNCDLCVKPLSHLLRPPPAVECRRCVFRCHRSHIGNESLPQCWKTGDTKALLVMAPSVDACEVWVQRIKAFMDYQTRFRSRNSSRCGSFVRNCS